MPVVRVNNAAMYQSSWCVRSLADLAQNGRPRSSFTGHEANIFGIPSVTGGLASRLTRMSFSPLHLSAACPSSWAVKRETRRAKGSLYWPALPLQTLAKLHTLKLRE